MLFGEGRGEVYVKTDCLHATVRGNGNVTGGYAPNEGSTNRVATVNGVCRSSEGGPRVESEGAAALLSRPCASRRAREKEGAGRTNEYDELRRGVNLEANGCLNAKPAGSHSGPLPLRRDREI